MRKNLDTTQERPLANRLGLASNTFCPITPMYGFASKWLSFPDYVEKLDGDTLFDRLCIISVERGHEPIELAPFTEMAKEKAPE